MSSKTIFLDHFALVRITSDAPFAALAKEFIVSQGYTLTVGVMNLMELYKWKKGWEKVLAFISSVPFCIARNSEEITAQEILNYPNEIPLPTGFSSADYSYTRDELAEAIKTNLEAKIALFDKRYRQERQDILDDILNQRSRFPPDEGGKYSLTQRTVFLNASVLAMLFPDYRDSLQAKASKSKEIRIECFKSVFIQALAIFLEYYVQNKKGKPSDIGDFYQLSYVPYVDLSIVDNERNDLIQRMNRTGLFLKRLDSCNLAQFQNLVKNRA